MEIDEILKDIKYRVDKRKNKFQDHLLVNIDKLDNNNIKQLWYHYAMDLLKNNITDKTIDVLLVILFYAYQHKDENKEIHQETELL